MKDSASALDHYEQVNEILESAVFEGWQFVTDKTPAQWQEGFDVLIRELHANQVKADISYPLERGEVKCDPYDLDQTISSKANYREIEQIKWNMSDDRAHSEPHTMGENVISPSS
eukprot:4921696-Amphidinium_carterae.1